MNHPHKPPSARPTSTSRAPASPASATRTPGACCAFSSPKGRCSRTTPVRALCSAVLAVILAAVSLAPPAQAAVSATSTSTSTDSTTIATAVASAEGSTLSTASAAATTSSAYAVYSSNVLTFYYDTSSSSRSGTVYSVSSSGYSSASSVPWYSIRTSVKTVSFSSNFAGFLPTSTAYWFYGMTALTSISNSSYLQTANVTTMAYMFYNCNSLTSLAAGYWITKNVTSLKYTFYNCKSLTSLVVYNWQTSNVTTLNSTFYNCNSLTTINLRSWKTANVTVMTNTFYSCGALTTIKASTLWSTDSVTTSEGMFYGCTKLSGDGASYNVNYVKAARATFKAYLTKVTCTKYTLTLSSNTTSSSTFSCQVVSGQSYRIPTLWSQTGYTLSGWASSSSSSSASWSALGSISITTDKTIYALWSAVSVTLTYNYNYDSKGTYATQTVTYDSSFTTKTLSRTGYNLLGWSTSSSATTAAYEASETVTSKFTSSTTLYAVWSAVSVKLTYDYNYNSKGTYASQTVTYGSTFTTKTLSRTGYTLLGWSTSSSATSATYAASATLTSSFTSATTLYAVWSAVSVTLTYNYNYDSKGTYATQTVTYGSSFTTKTLSRTGYTLLGWSTSSSATSATYAASASLTSSFTSATTLYAVWSVNTYTITYDYNYDSKGTYATQTVSYGSTWAPSSGPSRSGYAFIGWATSSSATSATYATSTSYTWTRTSSLTLYAVWSANTYIISFDANGGDGEMDDVTCAYDAESELPTCTFTRGGYTFSSWNTASDGSGTSFEDGGTVIDLAEGEGDEVTLFAIWQPNTYNIAFNANGGTGEMETISCSYGTSVELPACTFERSGYAFAGWGSWYLATEASFEDGETVTDLTQTNGATITLFAVWSAVTYEVAFDANGGTGEMETISCTYGEGIVLDHCTFALEGCAFSGWSLDATAENPTWADCAAIDDLADEEGATVTLFAIWSSGCWTLAFDANGGEGVMGTRAVACGDTVTLPACTYTLTGHSFSCWCVDANGEGQTFAAGSETDDLTADSGETLTVFALWDEDDSTSDDSTDETSSDTSTDGTTDDGSSADGSTDGATDDSSALASTSSGTSSTASASTTATTTSASSKTSAASGKKAQKLAVKKRARVVSAAVLAKKGKVAVKALTVTGASGKLAYKLTGVWTNRKTLFSDGVGGKISVNAKTGKIVLKRGLARGRAYRVRIRVTAKATAACKAATKTVTVTIRVK